MKTKTTHTPGPWTTVPWPASTSIVWGDSAQDRVYPCPVKPEGSSGIDAVAVAYGSTQEEADATGRLIAAAPQLLYACELIDEWHDLVKQNYPEMLRPFIKARAALAAARGDA